MSYFRHRYSSFEEFQREGLSDPEPLGKEELELLQELEDDEAFDRKSSRRSRSYWD